MEEVLTSFLSVLLRMWLFLSSLWVSPASPGVSHICLSALSSSFSLDSELNRSHTIPMPLGLARKELSTPPRQYPKVTVYTVFHMASFLLSRMLLFGAGKAETQGTFLLPGISVKDPS